MFTRWTWVIRSLKGSLPPPVPEENLSRQLAKVTHWSHPSFIPHQTPERRGTAPFMPGLWQRVHDLKLTHLYACILVKGTDWVVLDTLHITSTRDRSHFIKKHYRSCLVQQTCIQSTATTWYIICCCPSANRQVSNEMQTSCGTPCYTTEDDVFQDNKVGKALQDLANPAARLRILICEHQTIQAEHKEREFLVAECGCHLRDRHHAHAMTLHTHRTLTSSLSYI